MKKLLSVISIGLVLITNSLVAAAGERSYLDDISTIKELYEYVSATCPDSENSRVLTNYRLDSQQSVGDYIREVVSEGCFPCCFCCGKDGDCCDECNDNNSLTANIPSRD